MAEVPMPKLSIEKSSMKINTRKPHTTELRGTRRATQSRVPSVQRILPQPVYRYALGILTLCLVIAGFSSGARQTWAMSDAQQEDPPTADNSIYLPFIAVESGQVVDGAENSPTVSDMLQELSGNSTPGTNDAPVAIDPKVEASTFCSTYIRFANYGNQSAYIYWESYYGNEVLYATLPGGYYYWQQSYYGHKWIVRDGAGNQVKSFRAQSCWYLYVNLYDNDFPIHTAPEVSCPAGTQSLLVNGSFEKPSLRTRWDAINESSVPGWRTTANDDEIEIWQHLGVEGVPSYEGSQHNELNAAGSAAIYQDYATTPGSTIRWSFAHRGRSGVDTVRLRIGSPSAQVNQADFSTGKTWNNYTGTYVVPAGQTTTRIKFDPIAVASGNASVGNLLDGVLVCELPAATATPVPPPTNTATPVPPTPTATTPAVVSCPGNLVTNAGFEADFNSWTIGSYTNAQLTLSTDAHSGTQAALARGTGVFINQQIAALGGANYTVSYFGKTNNGVIFSAIGLNFYNGSGTRVGQVFARATAANYSELSAAFTAPGNTAFAEAYLYTDGGSDFYVDDVCVTRNGGPTPTLTPGPETVQIGDRIWIDANRDGIQDEAGSNFAGVAVELYEQCDNENAVATDITSGTGQYLFTNLAPGQYRVKVNVPAGYVVSAKGKADDASDSDFFGNGLSACLTLAPGVPNYDVDAGLYNPTVPIPTPTPTPTPIGGYLGDRVWEDQNRNGVQDGGEPNLEGVRVELLGTCAGDTLITAQNTNNGQYIFRDLAAGQYLVRVVAPAGMVFSPQNASADDSGDSDVDSNGLTPCITLSPYEEDYSIDAGLYNPQETVPTPTPTATPAGATIGDRVWQDFNANGVQNAGEPGYGGVTVNLLSGCTGTTLVTSTTTQNNGAYSFYPLTAGDYRIQVIAPAGLAFSPQGATGEPFGDSDVDSSGMSACIALGAIEERSTIDAGLYDPNAPIPTATDTPLPPTPTHTGIPPTPTFTPTQTPTPTNTPVPPTPTHTPIPPTPTSTPGTPPSLVTCPDGSTPLLLNGSFEAPILPAAWQLIDEAQVPGWLTNATDNKIEIAQSGAYGISSFDGVQFNELNASSAAALYQDIATTPGSTILWGFAHRGRNGTDTVSLRLGSPSNVAEQAKFNTNNDAWLEFTGTYIVPTGQTTTRVEFSPLSTAGGLANEGNFLDGILVCQLP